MLAIGCSPGLQFAHVPVTANHATVPISMTSFLVDDDGIVDPSRLNVVGHFTFESDECPTSIDISGAVNRQVARVNGDALVRMNVVATANDLCIKTTVTADIVKVATAEGS